VAREDFKGRLEMNRFVIVLCVTALVGLASTVARADTVTNGGFENGDFTGWSTDFTLDGNPIAGNDPSAWTFVDTQQWAVFPNSGIYAAYFGQSDGQLDSISQTISTVQGQTYEFSWWLAGVKADDYSITPNEMKVSWNGTAVSDTVDTTTQTWNQFSFLETATSTSTTISFAGAANGFLALDDVSVQPVPEPGVLTGLLGLAGMGLVGLVWRRRRG